MAVKDDPQIAIDEVFIEDVELLEALGTWSETADAARQHKAAKATIDGLLGERFKDAPDGKRVRCGSYTITYTRRAGGGFNVGTWEKSFIGSIAEAS